MGLLGVLRRRRSRPAFQGVPASRAFQHSAFHFGVRHL